MTQLAVPATAADVDPTSLAMRHVDALPLNGEFAINDSVLPAIEERLQSDAAAVPTATVNLAATTPEDL